MIKTSLDHLPEGKQRTIEEIRRLILNQVEDFYRHKASYDSIVAIVLFGSYARGTYVEDPVNGYISDFDILISVNGDGLANNTSFWYGIEDKADQLTRTPLNLIVHTHQEVADKLREGHYFFTDIRNDGIYLYTSQPDKGLPEPKRLSKAERLPIAQQHFDQWFENANEFLVAYDAMIKNGSLKNAAFQLHQATERFYGCVLLVLSNYRPKTHNIERLRKMAIQRTNAGEALTEIFAGKDRLQRRSFQRLKRAYIDARYSEHYDITKDELDWLAQQTEQLKDVVNTICKTYIDHLSN